MIRKFKRKDRPLGVSEKHTYDIPLDKGSGRLFLTVLTGLMVFLMLLSVSSAYILKDFAANWQTGLEGRWTVELPVIDENGEPLTKENIDSFSADLLDVLTTFHAVKSAELLSEEKITEMLSPWFDMQPDMDNSQTSDSEIFMPIPVLISLDMKETGNRTAHDIRMQIEEVTPLARLDKHESWLEELLRLTGTLRLVAVLITVVISAAGILAVAGAMQSRMAEHKESVELLHLMGAGDNYIARQFQRHAFIISLQGALVGLFICAVFIYGLGLFLSGSEDTLLPTFTPTPMFWLCFLVVPSLIIMLCVMTTRWAVLHRLQKML